MSAKTAQEIEHESVNECDCGAIGKDGTFASGNGRSEHSNSCRIWKNIATKTIIEIPYRVLVFVAQSYANEARDADWSDRYLRAYWTGILQGINAANGETRARKQAEYVIELAKKHIANKKVRDMTTTKPETFAVVIPFSDEECARSALASIERSSGYYCWLAKGGNRKLTIIELSDGQKV